MKFQILILLIGLFASGCVNTSQSVITGNPAAITREINRQSDEIVSFRSVSYNAAVIKLLTPELRRRTAGFRAEIDAYKDSANKRNVADPDLLSIPRDLLLLRSVVPNFVSIEDALVDASKATVVLNESMVGDGKVYQSYKGFINFEFDRIDDKWLLSDIVINRQGTPFRLTEYYDKRLSYFRDQVQYSR